MAQENIIIDLTDENLVIKPDVYVDGGILDASGVLSLTRTDGGTVSVDLAPLLTDVLTDVYVTGATYNSQTSQLLFHYSDGRADVSVDLSSMIFREYGGTNYDPSKTDYPVGHIVSIPDGSVWVAMVDPQTAQPSDSNTEWKRVGSGEERGGILYDGTTTYEVGDIVALGGKGYINQQAGSGVPPIPGGNASWIDMSLSEYYVGEHTPVGGSEYPNTTGETPGAYWQVSGVTGTYTMTSGDLNGRKVKNGDRFLWNGTSWSLFAAPAIIEYGGVSYVSNHIYTKGTIVSFGPDSVPYVCILDTTLTDGSQDPTNSTYWKKVSDFERGGTVWENGTNYLVGDIVSDNSKSYIAIQDSLGQRPSTSPGQWLLNSGSTDTERGGIAWQAASTYLVGDVVSEGTKIYIRINTGGSGSTPPSGDSVYWQLLDTSRSNAGLWKNNITYYEGDIVTWKDELYIAPPGGVPVGTEPPSGGWIAGNYEVGGIEYNSALSYSVGDIVAEGNQVYVSLTGTTVSPSSSTSDWKRVGGGADIAYDDTRSYLQYDLILFNGKLYFQNSSTPTTPGTDPDNSTSWTSASSSERGGIAWTNGRSYSVGDIVSKKVSGLSTIFIAILDNIDEDPEAGIGSWELLQYTERGGTGWISTVEYKKDDFVIYKDIAYVALRDNVNIYPESGFNDWVEYHSRERGGIEWNSEYTYYSGDLVTEGSGIYRAIRTNTNSSPSSLADWVNVNAGEVPLGGIIMYDGSYANIPSSYALCDGTNGTPDLRDRFIYGAATEADIGNTGGSKASNMPAHTHTANHNHPAATTSSNGSHNHTINHDHPVDYTSDAGNHSHSTGFKPVTVKLQSGAGSYGLVTGGSNSTTTNGSHSHKYSVEDHYGNSGTTGAHTHTLDIPNMNVTTSSAGVNNAEGNLPPYFKLAYIKRIA